MTDQTTRHPLLRLPLLPGLTLTLGLAVLALAVQRFSGLAVLSPLIVAVCAGLALGNLTGVPAAAAAGVAFSQKTLLRLGIVLLGLRLTLADVQGLGLATLALVVLVLGSTFVVIRLLGRVLGVDAGLTTLIAAGTSVCGASAVIAANAVARAREEDVTYAIATVTVLGTVALFLFPMVATWTGVEGTAFGIWSGAAVHEVAQVAAVAFQHSDQAGEVGTVTKLFRVMLLAPLIMVLSLRGQAEAGPRPPFPWFVAGFAALVCVNSLIDLPQALLAPASAATDLLLTMALAAMGLNTRIAQLRARGLRPALLATLGSLYIAAASLSLILLFGL
ncbi:YeiH family protein [Pseudooceanicola aestuarii]|uniref:YeiH family protein n=1 Tax=Pseudooceanicola aestuarii TaxID=2697319 RepID=UPI0013D0E331|nr:putative sulfate exporter family transporter [Pseudooceanicola aestuarii]